jgi:hypothetical protein
LEVFEILTDLGLASTIFASQSGRWKQDGTKEKTSSQHVLTRMALSNTAKQSFFRAGNGDSAMEKAHANP